jgi:hypothetical protein
MYARNKQPDIKWEKHVNIMLKKKYIQEKQQQQKRNILNSYNTGVIRFLFYFKIF